MWQSAGIELLLPRDYGLCTSKSNQNHYFDLILMCITRNHEEANHNSENYDMYKYNEYSNMPNTVKKYWLTVKIRHYPDNVKQLQINTIGDF